MGVANVLLVAALACLLVAVVAPPKKATKKESIQKQPINEGSVRARVVALSVRLTEWTKNHRQHAARLCANLAAYSAEQSNSIDTEKQPLASSDVHQAAQEINTGSENALLMEMVQQLGPQYLEYAELQEMQSSNYIKLFGLVVQETVRFVCKTNGVAVPDLGPLTPRQEHVQTGDKKVTI